LGVSAALAQQPGIATSNAAVSASNALTNPPVFQGLMVDAKGKTVGRFYPGGLNVVRQINGVWVWLSISDLTTGFQPDGSALYYYYQSTDCTGQAYLSIANGGNSHMTAPAYGQVLTIPPATAPSIYFAGTPASVVTIQSERNQNAPPTACNPYSGGVPLGAGPVHNVPVSSLGLTLPFSIK
jgi:hypothetical protein